MCSAKQLSSFILTWKSVQDFDLSPESCFSGLWRWCVVSVGRQSGGVESPVWAQLLRRIFNWTAAFISLLLALDSVKGLISFPIPFFIFFIVVTTKKLDKKENSHLLDFSVVGNSYFFLLIYFSLLWDL